MIRARAGEIVIFGLSAENVKRLREGKPIFFDAADVGLPAKIAIVFGETEAEIAKDLRSAMVGAVEQAQQTLKGRMQ